MESFLALQAPRTRHATQTGNFPASDFYGTLETIASLCTVGAAVGKQKRKARPSHTRNKHPISRGPPRGSARTNEVPRFKISSGSMFFTVGICGGITICIKQQKPAPHPLHRLTHTHTWSQLEIKSCFYPPPKRKEGSQGCCLSARPAGETGSSLV